MAHNTAEEILDDIEKNGADKFAREFDKNDYEMSQLSWPMIVNTVPEVPIEDEERERINQISANLVSQIKAVLSKEPVVAHLASDEGIEFKVFTEQLKQSCTEEQVRLLAFAYLISQVNLKIIRAYEASQLDQLKQMLVKAGAIPEGEGVRSALRGMAGEMSNPVPFHYARNPEFAALQQVFHHDALQMYSSKGGFGSQFGHNGDSLFMLLADPEYVINASNKYMRDARMAPECIEMLPKAKRGIPENKRMTKEKLARFFQFPGLRGYIDKDSEIDKSAMGSNLVILAEYFYENDDVLTKNEITAEDVESWLKEKFEKHQPNMDLARYVWSRLFGTEFEHGCLFIEQYMLDLHEKEGDGELFDTVGIKRSGCTDAGSIFRLYNALMEHTDRKALMRYLPAVEYVQATMATSIYGKQKDISTLLEHFKRHSVDFDDDLSVNELESDPVTSIIKFLNKEKGVRVKTEWKAHEGFEVLDPMIIYLMSQSNEAEASSQFQGKVSKRIMELEVKELIELRDRHVELEDEKEGEGLKKALDKLIDVRAGRVLLMDDPTIELVGVARGETSRHEEQEIVFDDGSNYHELTGRRLAPKRISRAAEVEIVSRHFKGARGSDEIIRHVIATDIVRPSELVIPGEDAPNREIIAEYKESPDVLSLAQAATNLYYSGVDPDDIVKEVSILAELSQQESRPELTTVGAELELTNVNGHGEIIDKDTYPDLFNIYPIGNDMDCNELTTGATASDIMQAAFLSSVADPRFGYTKANNLWAAERDPNVAPSSIHVSLAFPKDLLLTPKLKMDYLKPLTGIQWIAHGGDEEQHRVGKAKVRSWASPRTFLDVESDKCDDNRLEIRNLTLQEDGSHIRNMQQLRMIGSAGIQFMREKSQQKQTPSGLVMAQIYERFVAESKILTRNPNEAFAAEAAKALLERFASEIESELNIQRSSKTEGVLKI